MNQVPPIKGGTPIPCIQLHIRSGGGGGFGKKPCYCVLVCSWRRPLADRHLLPFPSLSFSEGPPSRCFGPPFPFLHRWWVASTKTLRIHTAIPFTSTRRWGGGGGGKGGGPPPTVYGRSNTSLPPPPCQRNPRFRILTETTPTVALTRALLSQGGGGGAFWDGCIFPHSPLSQCSGLPTVALIIAPHACHAASSLASPLWNPAADPVPCSTYLLAPCRSYAQLPKQCGAHGSCSWHKA